MADGLNGIEWLDLLGPPCTKSTADNNGKKLE